MSPSTADVPGAVESVAGSAEMEDQRCLAHAEEVAHERTVQMRRDLGDIFELAVKLAAMRRQCPPGGANESRADFE